MKWLDRRRTEADLRVLGALRFTVPVDRYELWTRTGLRPRRLRATLHRLEKRGLVVVKRYRPSPQPREMYRAACPCGADAVAAAHEPGCREAP